MDFGITIEIICFITALICLWKDKSSVWRSFSIYLLITCIAEITGVALRKSHHYNQWVYNTSLVFEAVFNSLLFGSILNKYINSKPLILSGLAIILFVYVYDLSTHGFFIFNDYTATVMSVIFVVYSFYYYFLLIKDEQYTDLKRDAYFWWVTGALFFYFGSTVSNVFYGFLGTIKFNGHNITYYSTGALCIILYGCWTYSFICRKWLTTKSGN